MPWLPYERCTLVSPLPVQEAIARLQGGTAKQEFRLLSRPREAFIGTADVSGFTLRRNIMYRNSFLPYLFGRFSTAGTATVVELTMRPHAFVLVFMSIWLGGVGVAALVFTWPGLRAGALSPELLIPLGMFVLGYGIMIGGFLFERKRSLEELQRLLAAERVPKRNN